MTVENAGVQRPTFLCCVDQYTKNIVRLRDYSLPDEPKVDAKIHEAALATSAATTFFNLVKIGDLTFADGGLIANNPVDEVDGEAGNIFCSDTGDVKPLVKCFISIGTENPGMKRFETSILKFFTQTLVQIATETESTEKKFIARWARHYEGKRYFRFNVDQGLQGIGLDEYKKKGDIGSANEDYPNHQSQKFHLRHCQ